MFRNLCFHCSCSFSRVRRVCDLWCSLCNGFSLSVLVYFMLKFNVKCFTFEKAVLHRRKCTNLCVPACYKKEVSHTMPYLFLQTTVSLFSIMTTDHRKLPFMAMLRNLRNLIKAGISDKHHNAVIRRLTDQVGQHFIFVKFWCCK